MPNRRVSVKVGTDPFRQPRQVQVKPTPDFVQVEETPVRYQDPMLVGGCGQGYLWTGVVPGQWALLRSLWLGAYDWVPHPLWHGEGLADSLNRAKLPDVFAWRDEAAIAMDGGRDVVEGPPPSPA